MVEATIAEPDNTPLTVMNRVLAWQMHHGETWQALTHAWRAGGGSALTLLPLQPVADRAFPIAADGETVAWLAGEPADAGRQAWLESVASLIGEAVARETELDAMTDELVDTYDQLTFLYETARTVLAADTLVDALRQVVRQARHIVGAEGGALTVMRDGTDALVLTDGVVPDTGFVLTAHDAAVRHARALVANTATAVREMLGENGSTAGGDVSSMIVASIHASAGFASVACFGATRPTGFTAGNRQLMQAVVEQSISIVGRFALQEEQIRRGRIARDLELAMQMQTALLPAPFPGLSGVDLAVRILPANEVGGDFYIHPDGTKDPDGVVVIGIGDVAGKGIAAAMVVTMCLSALRAEMRHTASPATAMRAVGTFIEEELERIGSFVTGMIASYDIGAREMRYANAGHSPALHWHATTGKITTLAATGLPLGVDIGLVVQDATVPFLPGDVLLLYTDGVTEAMNARGEQFGIQRLRRTLCAAAPHASATRIVDAVVGSVHAFAPVQRDDITVMVLQATEART